MLGNLFNADLQVAAFIEISYQLFRDGFIVRGNQSLQLLQQRFGKRFPCWDTC